MQYGALWHDVHSKLEEDQQRADDTGLANRYQWDTDFTDGNVYKQGVGGQGLYVSPGRDLVMCWFCTSDGRQGEQPMARAIAKSL